ncbi:MAG: HPr-rel-A system PqqD family peptide chaperone [Sphingomonadaceae bacterium]
MHYLSAGSGALKAVELDTLTAIYDRRSGQTHVVVSPVPEILEALLFPRTLGGLIAALGADDDDATRAILTERLKELRDIGLIDRS